MWCYIILVCTEIGLVDGDVCGWGCAIWVTFVCNVPSRFFLSITAMVLRPETSMISFRYICLTSTCSRNNFNQYGICNKKDDSRAIAWVLSCPFPTGPSCLMVFFYAIYATSSSVCSTSHPLLIVIASLMVWYGAAVGWDSGDVLAVASIRVVIADCVGSKYFSALT